MAYSIFYFDEVEIDIKEARSWYKATDEKLDNRFVQAIENTIIKLQEWPKAYEFVIKMFVLHILQFFHTRFTFILMMLKIEL
jgi:hypothetical protein